MKQTKQQFAFALITSLHHYLLGTYLAAVLRMLVVDLREIHLVFHAPVDTPNKVLISDKAAVSGGNQSIENGVRKLNYPAKKYKSASEGE